MSEATAAASNDDWSTYTREYRIMQTDADTWEVREVYFDEAGKVVAWTGHAARLWGVSESDLRAAVQDKLDALARPVLVETELPHYIPDSAEDHDAAPVEEVPATGHDPLCDWWTEQCQIDCPAYQSLDDSCEHQACVCGLVARVRADGR